MVRSYAYIKGVFGPLACQRKPYNNGVIKQTETILALFSKVPGKSNAAAYLLPTVLRSRVFLQPACWDRRRPRLLLVQKPMSDSRSGMHSRLLLLQRSFFTPEECDVYSPARLSNSALFGRAAFVRT